MLHYLEACCMSVGGVLHGRRRLAAWAQRGPPGVVCMGQMQHMARPCSCTRLQHPSCRSLNMAMTPSPSSQVVRKNLRVRLGDIVSVHQCPDVKYGKVRSSEGALQLGALLGRSARRNQRCR